MSNDDDDSKDNDDDSVQEEWKEKFKEREVEAPPEETQTPGEAYISRGSSRGGLTTSRTITPTTSQEFQAKIFKDQGKTVTVSKEGLRAVDPRTQRQTVVSKYGDIITAPTSATVGTSSQIRQSIEQRGITQLKQEKERQEAEAKKISEQAKGKGRPAEESSRIVLPISEEQQAYERGEFIGPISQSQITSKKVESLFLKRKTELLRESGKEAQLPHYPQYNIGTDRPIGRQEYGTSPTALKGKSFIDTLREQSTKIGISIREKAERFSPFIGPEARVEYTEDGKPILTTKYKQASFAEAEKKIIPKPIQEYTTKRKEYFEKLPDYSFKETITSPSKFFYEVSKASGRSIAGIAGEFTESPVKSSLYAYSGYKLFGALPKTKIVKYALGGVFVGGNVVSKPKSFLRPSGYLETASELALWKLAFKGAEKLKGSKAFIKTATYKQPVQEKLKVAPIGKKGSIKTAKILPSVEYTVQGRIKPIDYAKVLASEGKIDFKTPDFIVSKTGEKTGISGLVRGIMTRKPKVVIAKYKVDYILKVGEMPKETFNLVSKNLLQQTTAHELIHYKTPKALFLSPAELLPYRQKPSEIIAWGLEKRYASKGFKISQERIFAYQKKVAGDITLRKEGVLKFKYPRERLVQKSFGKNIPTVSVSKGYVTRAGEISTVRTVTVGRKVYGSIIGKREDIIFMKGKKGGIFTKTLAKEKLDTKLVSQIKAEIYSKAQGTIKGKDFEPSLIKGTKTIPYAKESLTFKYKDRLSAIKPSKKFLDIGVKVDKQTAYYLRNVERTRAFETFAASKKFKGTREVIKSFKGKAVSKLVQTDVASPKTITTKYGEDLIIEKYIPDIKYAYQPSYKPSTKAYTSFKTKEGVIPISQSVKMPKLLTSRKTGFVSKSLYSVEQTSPKPFKRIISDLPKIGKKAQVGITKGVTILKTSKPTPEIYKPDERIPITGEELFSITGKPTARVVYPLPITERKGEDKQIEYITGKSELSYILPVKKDPTSFIKEESKFVTKSVTSPDMLSYLKLKTPTMEITKTPTKSRIRTEVFYQTKIPTITPTKTPTKTLSKTRVSTVTRTRTMTKTPTIFERRFIQAGIPTPKIPTPIVTELSTFYKRDSYSIQKAFRVFLGSGKKERQIGKGLTRGEALKLGSSKTLKSIKAKFRIQEAGTTTRKEKKFKVSEKFFREFKISKGKKIYTPGTFIQKRGTRLTTQAERKEIQSLKKLKTRMKVKQYAI